MDLSKINTGALAVIVAVSVCGLLGIQYLILKKDLEVKDDQVSLLLPTMLMEFNDQLDFNKPLVSSLRNYRGGTVDFMLTNNSVPQNTIEEELKNEWDKVLNLNYPEMQYEMAVFLTTEYGCIFHSQHSKGLPKKAHVVMGDNHLCLCRLSRTTLDIRLATTNKSKVVLNETSPIFLISLAFIGVISLAFIYTIVTIGKQKRLSQMKNDFINNMTHELKTPIFSISLAAKSLGKSKEVADNASLNNYIGLINTETDRLKNQVDKVLQMSVIDSEGLSLEIVEIDLHVLVTEVVKSFEVMINDLGGKMEVALNANKVLVLGDEVHLKNVIYNLLDNAVKYSKDAPHIEIETVSNKTNIVMSIRDHGIGMSEEAKTMAFNKFYREQKGDLHDVKGFGLGLSYVKGVVDAHKARISVTSKKGDGSIFMLTFPLA